MSDNLEYGSLHYSKPNPFKSAACGICFDKINPEITEDPGHIPITCQNCAIVLHRRCYGMLSSEMKSFVCDKCANPSAMFKTCVICDRAEGYLKQVVEGVWVHPICGLLTDDVEVDFATMSMQLLYELPAQGTVPQCEFCGVTTGQRLQCGHAGCLKAAHAYCAFHSKMANESNCWQINLSLGNGSKENPFPDFKAHMDSMSETKTNVKPVEEVKVTRTLRRHAGPEPSECRQRNSILERRGGKITLYCQSHSISPTYCICGGDKTKSKKDENWMIACDYCDNWYHGECIGISESQSETMKVYVCDRCKSWESAKRLYLLKEVDGKPYDEEAIVKRNDWENPLLPSTTNKLIDIFLVAHIYAIRGELVLKLPCNIELIYNHLMHGIEIPMKVYVTIEKLKKKMAFGIELDKEAAALIKGNTVATIVDSSYNLIEQNYNNNEEYKDLIDNLITRYTTEGNISTSLLRTLGKTQLTLASLHQIGNSFFTYMEIDTATMVLRQLEESGLGFSSEVQFLKDMILEFRTWESRLIPLEEVKVEDSAIYPEDGISQLEAKLQAVEGILKAKVPLSQVSQLLQDLSLYFIRKKAISESLENERSLFEEREKMYKSFRDSGCTLDQFKQLIKEMCECLTYSEVDMEILQEYKTYLRLYFVAMEMLKNGVLIDELSGNIIKAKCNFEDVEDIIAKCEYSAIQPLDTLGALRSRLEDVKKWRETYKELVNKGESTETLHAFIIKGEDYKLSLPEFENIQSQVEVLKYIEAFNTSNDIITFDYLLQLTNKAISSNVPETVVAPLKALLASVESLMNESQRLAEEAVDSYKEVENVRNCIVLIKRTRVTVPALEILEKVIKEYKWQAEVASLANVSPADCIEYEALESLSNDALEEEYKRSREITHDLIGPARSLKQRIPEVLWLKKAKQKLDPTNKLIEKELVELLEGMNEAGIDSSHPYCSTFAKLTQSLHENYLKIMDNYESLINVDIDSIAETEIDDILQRTRNFKQDAFICQINLSELISKIHRLEQCINAYKTLLEMLKEPADIDFTAYVKTVNNFSSLQEGRNECKFLEKAKDQMKKYSIWIDEVNEYKAWRDSVIKGNTKQKVSMDKLKKLIDDANAIELPLEKTLKLLKEDIEQGAKNDAFAKDLLNRLRNKESNIKTVELEEIIKRTKVLPLDSNEVFNSLSAYLVLFQSQDLIKGGQGGIPKRTLSYWNTLLRERERMISAKGELVNELADKKLTEELIEKHTEGLMLMRQINDLKEDKAKERFSIIDLGLLIDFLKESCIDFASEIKYAEDLLEKAKALEESFKELVETKASISKFKLLSKKIIKLPINLNESESKLSRILQKVDELLETMEDLLEDVRKDKSKLTETELLPLLSSYSKLQCTVNEMEKLKSQYDEAKKVIVRSKELLDKKASPETIIQITCNISNLNLEMDISIKPLLLEICKMKYAFMTQTSDSKKNYKLTLSSLRILLKDYKNLKEYMEPLDFDKIKRIEQLVQEANRKLRRIKDITDVEELNKYSAEIANESIDFTESIMEQRIRIELNFTIKEQLSEKRSRPENVEAELIAQGYTIIKSKQDLEKLTSKRQQEDEIREKSMRALEIIINENPRLKKGKKSPEVLANKLEEAILKQSKTTNSFYRERVLQVKHNLTVFAEHPLLSDYIAEGKFDMWKLLKLRDNYTFESKLNKIERILATKKKASKVGEENSPAKKNLRHKLFHEDRKEKFMSDRYDPLQPLMSQLHSGRRTEYIYQDEESLEEAEIAGEANFGMEVAGYPGIRVIPYNPTMPELPSEIKPYNPMESELDYMGGLNRPRLNQKTALVPYSYDINETAQEQSMEEVLPGSLLKIWAGKIATTKLTFRCTMFTCDNINEYRQAPALNLNLDIKGRAKLPSVFDYIDSNVSRFSILKGWVTVEDSPAVLSSLNNYLIELTHTDQAGVIDIKEIASHLYLIPWNSRTLPFILKWRINPVSIPNEVVKFAYFFAYKRQNFLGMYKAMQPVLMKDLEVQVPFFDSEFPGLVQADVLSDDEGQYMPVPNEVVEDEKVLKQALKAKLSELSISEIIELRSQLKGQQKEELERLLVDMSSQDVPYSAINPEFPLEVNASYPQTQYPINLNPSNRPEHNPQYQPETDLIQQKANIVPSNEVNAICEPVPDSIQKLDVEYNQLSQPEAKPSLEQPDEHKANDSELIPSNMQEDVKLTENEGTDDYLQKVWRVQYYIDRNRPFFTQYAQSLQTQAVEQTKYNLD